MAEFSVIGQAQLTSTLHLLTATPQGGQVTGHVFGDDDRDGNWDRLETGLDDFIVYIDANTNGSRDGNEVFTITDGSGAYTLIGVSAGTHTIAIEGQAGFIQTHPDGLTRTVNVGGGGGVNTLANNDFGFREVSNVPVGNLQDQLWYDLDGNGVQIPLEPLLDGWTVYIDSNSNDQLDFGEQSSVTNDAGNFQFTNIDPGNYRIAAVPMTGWQATQPLSGFHDIELQPGEGFDEIDFGFELNADGVPGQPDLVNANDSGSSDSDNVTNQNSDLQILVSNSIPAADVSLYQVDADTGFGVAHEIAQGNTTWTHAADFDNDGDNDVLRADRVSGTITMYANDGNGNFSTGVVISDSAGDVRSLYSDDVDLDGDIDVLFASVGSNGRFAWLENDGQGSFAIEQQIGPNLPHAAYTIFTADFDGDGDPDVVGGTRFNSLLVFENTDGDGTFDAGTAIDPSIESVGGRSVIAADFDGDNDQDIIAVREGPGDVLLYRNNGQGEFAAAEAIADDQDDVTAVWSDDLDNDGDEDLLVGGFGGPLSVFFNGGNADFASPILLIDDGGRTLSVQTGDFDSDGDVDIVSTHSSDIEWFENLGNGQFAESQLIVGDAPNPNPVVVVDLNSDDRLDVLSVLNGQILSWFENEPRDLLLDTVRASGWRTSFTTSFELPDGDTQFRASQQIGNSSEVFSTDLLTINVDTRAPIIEIQPLTTSDESPELTGNVDDPQANVTVEVDGSGPYMAINNQDGTWTLPAGVIAPALEPGNYDVQIRATDIAGNIGADGTADELIIEPVDNNPPSLLTLDTNTSTNDPSMDRFVIVSGHV